CLMMKTKCRRIASYMKCTYHLHLPSIKLSFPFQKLIKQDTIIIKAALHVHQ
ncbi:hypothetical protein S245_060573, partial [Arachis hypogaea]